MRLPIFVVASFLVGLGAGAPLADTRGLLLLVPLAVFLTAVAVMRVLPELLRDTASGRLSGLVGAVFVVGVPCALYAAVHTSKDYAGVFAAAVGATAAVVAAVLAAVTANLRQNEELAAARIRHLDQLKAERALKDREDLRDVVQDALRAHDLAFAAMRWNDAEDEDDAARRGRRRKAVLELVKAHNRLRVRDRELAEAWSTAYSPYLDATTWQLMGPPATARNAADALDQNYEVFIGKALRKTRAALPKN